MTTIIIQIEDEQARRLAEEADRRNVSLEELVQAGALSFLQEPTERLEQAIDYVMQKNRELYRRLA